MEKIILDQLCTQENFNEDAYLASNPDVADALRDGLVSSAREHFDCFGKEEGRRQRSTSGLQELQVRKIHEIEPLLNLNCPHVRRDVKYDFLTEALREETGISTTDAVSCNEYDLFVEELISQFPDGMILDCGAGKRPVYYSNVLNYEIVDYDSTDIIGVGEVLPFKSNSFDAVISIAVLEHVRNPFACAAEIARVLKPGGKLICAVPFLQPEHGYPHHYYNMAPQGLRALFDRQLQIDDHKVIGSLLPIWSLTWFLNSWAAGLTGAALEEFKALRISDLLTSPQELLTRDWVRELPVEKNFELASATLLFAHKSLTQGAGFQLTSSSVVIRAIRRMRSFGTMLKFLIWP